MYNYYEEDNNYAQARAVGYRPNKAEIRRKRRIRRRVRWFVTKLLPFCFICVLMVVGIGFGVKGIISLIKGTQAESEPMQEIQTYSISSEQAESTVDDLASTENSIAESDMKEGSDDTELALGEGAESHTVNYYADKTDFTTNLPDNALCTNGIYIDVEKKTVVMNRGGYDKIIPASMTKVLTLLVACEHISNFDDTYMVTADDTWYSYRNDLSAVGFANDETVSIWDLLYGTILPSGGDAAIALANYVAGSHEAFVEMMNEKVAELGLTGTHMTNCVGLYDEEHYSTCYDIAIIMMAAMDNEICRKILSEHKYVTSKTPEHSEGIEISNWFLRRIEDKDCGYFVAGAKTGFVKESGHNAVSYAEDSNNSGYICVTINSGGNWKCIYDHVRIYSSQSNPAG